MSLIPPSTSEKGAGGEDGGKDDSESRLVRGGGEDPGNDGLERLRFPLAPDWKDVSEVRERMWDGYHILLWMNAIKRDAREENAPDSDLDAFNYHVTCFNPLRRDASDDTLNRSRGEWALGRYGRRPWSSLLEFVANYSTDCPQVQSFGPQIQIRGRPR